MCFSMKSNRRRDRGVPRPRSANTLTWPSAAAAAELARVLRDLVEFANEFDQKRQGDAQGGMPAEGLKLGFD